MKLKMTVTFDPFVVSAPDLQAAIKAVKGGDSATIDTHPARDVAPKVKKKEMVNA